MKTNDDLLFETMSRALQACFEAMNELARDLSEPRKAVIFRITQRVLSARPQLEVLLDERRAELESRT